MPYNRKILREDTISLADEVVSSSNIIYKHIQSMETEWPYFSFEEARAIDLLKEASYKTHIKISEYRDYVKSHGVASRYNNDVKVLMELLEEMVKMQKDAVNAKR